MTRKINIVIIVLLILFVITLTWGYLNMFQKKIHIVTQPFRIAAPKGNHYYLFPPPETMMYFDKSLPDGTDRYYVYINIKGLPGEYKDLTEHRDIKSLTAYPVSSEDVSKMREGYPKKEEDLLKILNTQRLTKEEAQEVIDYLQQYIETFK